jgi:hypothetical protein
MSKNQRIGFGKKIRWDWLLLALRLRAKSVDFDAAREELEPLIAETNPGKAAIAKILSNLRQTIFEPVPACRDFSERGVALFQQDGEPVALPVIWGLSFSSYSFFAQSGETVGRLLRLHEEFTGAEMVRRLTERIGDRGFVSRVARYNLSSMLDWDLLEYGSATKTYRRGKVIVASRPDVLGWLAEGILLATSKSSMAQSQLLGSNLLFPFEIKPISLTQLTAGNPLLQVVRHSVNEESIVLRDPCPAG